MLLPPPAPVPVLAPAPQLDQPLSFAGFRAGMPYPEAAALVGGASGSASCKATADWRLRECTGRLTALRAPFTLLISSIHDSAAVIVLSLQDSQRRAPNWVAELTRTFGSPTLRVQSQRPTRWQWIRSGQMLRVIERRSRMGWETSVTLTYGPLLDGLGPTQRKRPDP